MPKATITTTTNNNNTTYHLSVQVSNYKKGHLYGCMSTLDHANEILARYNADPLFKQYVINFINKDIEHQAAIEKIKATPYNNLSAQQKQIAELF
jgi:hypothetical protein